MNDPADLDWREDVVRRLRELHASAEDEDRPRAALLLGLALADLVGQLPDGDARGGGLAAEGLAALAEAADASAAAATAAEALRRRLAAAAREPGPESFPLDGADLHWDLDWDTLRGPAEAAQNLTAMLPVLASMLPPQDRLRQALTSITEVLGAFGRGQWSPERDAALSTAITQVEASGLGAGLGLILRTVAMFIRAQRCQQVQRAGGEPDWPSAAELDALIAGLESADELAGGLGAPFQAVDGLHHLFIACMIMVRLQVGVRGRGVRRDAAWRDGILRLLDQADDHLGEVPAAYAGVIQPMRAKLATAFVALSPAPGSARSRSAPSPAPPPRVAPAAPRPAPPPAASPPAASPPAASPPAAPPPGADAGPPAAPTPAGTAVTDDDARPWTLDPAVGQLSPRVLDGLRILLNQAEGPVLTGLAAMLPIMDALTSRRWTPEHSDRLAELEEMAARLAAHGTSPRDHATVAAMLAMARVAQSGHRSMSPRPAEHASADEVAVVAAETESALELVAQAAGAAPDRLLDTLQGSLHALAAVQLVDLSRLDGQHRGELLARARAHFGQLPAEMLSQIPIIPELSVLEQLIEGVIAPDDEAVRSVADRNPNLWDQSGSDLNRALRAVTRAEQSRALADIGAALCELQAVWIGLPAGSALRARVLIPMAIMQSMLAVQGGQPAGAAEAVGTAIAAVRAATQPGEVHAAAQVMVTAFALMLGRGERTGPFQEAEETLRTALAGSDASDWALRATVLTAIGAAAAMRASASGDAELRAVSREAVSEAAYTLPDPAPTERWYAAARMLCAWTAAHGLCLGDAESAQLAFRLIDILEDILAGHPEAARRATDPPAAPGDSSAELDGLRQLRQQLLTAREQAATRKAAADAP